jgi:hypothetical protein
MYTAALETGNNFSGVFEKTDCKHLYIVMLRYGQCLCKHVVRSVTRLEFLTSASQFLPYSLSYIYTHTRARARARACVKFIMSIL